MESIKILFGKRVKELRKQHSYTQERLAELVGIDTRNLIKIENGQTFPRANTLDKLIEVFSITPDEILNADLYFIDKIGLKEHLSPTRSNGLLSMVKQIRMYALAFKAKEGK